MMKKILTWVIGALIVAGVVWAAQQTPVSTDTLNQAFSKVDNNDDEQYAHIASSANPHSVTAAQAGAVATTGNETVAGVKTFSSFPVSPSAAPTTDYQLANKKYVDDNVVSGGITSVLGDNSGAVPVFYQTWSAFTGADATPDVSTATFWRTVDTTTITDFDGTPTDGQMLVVYCGAATVFDLTSSGIESSDRTTDYTATVGDVLLFFYRDTQWYAQGLPHESIQAISLLSPVTNDIMYYDGSQWNRLTPAALMAIMDDLTWTFANEVTFSDGYGVSPSPTPTMELEDSDAPGADKESFKLYSNYIDGAEDAENHDFFLQAKQGGSYATIFQFDESDDQVEFLKNTDLQDNDIPASELVDWYAYDLIPIGWMKDGTSAPAALDDASTRSPFAYRDFDSTADEDLNFVWFVPSDLSGTTIQYRVKYLITNATGPSATEGVAFGLSGISAGDNDASNGTKGTVVVITDDTLNAAQHDVMITGWSGDVTVTNLAAGEVAEMALIRDVSDTVDDYGQDVGVFAVEIRYVKNPSR